jgi:hypothetical protein
MSPGFGRWCQNRLPHGGLVIFPKLLKNVTKCNNSAVGESLYASTGKSLNAIIFPPKPYLKNFVFDFIPSFLAKSLMVSRIERLLREYKDNLY